MQLLSRKAAFRSGHLAVHLHVFLLRKGFSVLPSLQGHSKLSLTVLLYVPCVSFTRNRSKNVESSNLVDSYYCGTSNWRNSF